MKPDGYVVEEQLLSVDGNKKYVFDNLVNELGVSENHKPVYFAETIIEAIDEVFNHDETWQATYLMRLREKLRENVL